MKFKQILYITLIFLTGCTQKGPYKGKKELIIKTHEKINDKLALRMYIVLTSSQETNNIIKDIDTISFFDKKKQLILDYPSDITIWEIDLINKNHPKCFQILSKKRYWGLYIFFRYIDNSESKYKYPEKAKTIIIKLKNDIFKIENISKRDLLREYPALKKFNEKLEQKKQ